MPNGGLTLTHITDIEHFEELRIVTDDLHNEDTMQLKQFFSP